MESVVLAHQVDFAGWRGAARRLALAGVPPENVHFSVGAPDDLFAQGGDAADEPAAEPPSAPATGGFTVSRALVELAQTVIQAREPERFDLLYGLLWRAQHGEKKITELVTDPAVQRAVRLAQSVRRDTHKMRAFLRFREVPAEAPPETPSKAPNEALPEGPRDGTGADGTRYVAWFEPEHFIVEANADFLVRRFATMLFTVLTPYRSLHWNGSETQFGPGADPSEVPDDDALERYWRAYYGAIFNPARLKVSAMRSEMPKKYWRNLPEAAAIPELIRTAGRRTETMLEAAPLDESERKPRPKRVAAAAGPGPSLDLALDPTPGSTPSPALGIAEAGAVRPGTVAELAQAAAACRRCHLWEPATQVVFGEGPADARMMMVGEQPGDQEDLAGRPFVGPAGQLLDRAITEAGIDRSTVYVTNAVKHFKFEPRGKRRIHAKPDLAEIRACNVWLEEERRAVKPALVVMLGATAARAVLGRAVTIGRERSQPIALPDQYGSNAQGFVTVHPSYLLRIPDEDTRQREYAAFVADLKQALALVNG